MVLILENFLMMTLTQKWLFLRWVKIQRVSEIDDREGNDSMRGEIDWVEGGTIMTEVMTGVL